MASAISTDLTQQSNPPYRAARISSSGDLSYGIGSKLFSISGSRQLSLSVRSSLLDQTHGLP